MLLLNLVQASSSVSALSRSKLSVLLFFTFVLSFSSLLSFRTDLGLQSFAEWSNRNLNNQSAGTRFRFAFGFFHHRSSSSLDISFSSLLILVKGKETSPIRSNSCFGH